MFIFDYTVFYIAIIFYILVILQVELILFGLIRSWHNVG